MSEIHRCPPFVFPCDSSCLPDSKKNPNTLQITLQYKVLCMSGESRLYGLSCKQMWEIVGLSRRISAINWTHEKETSLITAPNFRDGRFFAGFHIRRAG
jgi:hypothetical protein